MGACVRGRCSLSELPAQVGYWDAVVTVLKLEAGASYNVQKGLKASASLGFTQDITHGTSAFAATVGASVAVMDVDWNDLF